MFIREPRTYTSIQIDSHTFIYTTKVLKPEDFYHYFQGSYLPWVRCQRKFSESSLATLYLYFNSENVLQIGDFQTHSDYYDKIAYAYVIWGDIDSLTIYDCTQGEKPQSKGYSLKHFMNIEGKVEPQKCPTCGQLCK